MLAAAPGLAQMGPPGAGGPPQQAPQQQAPQQAPPQNAAPQGGGAPAMGGGGPEALYGLKPVETPEVLTLDEVLAAVATSSFDLRIAKEQLYQQKLNVEKAWTMIMPQLSAGGSYTYSLPEQEAEFFSAEQNQQQALLFRSIADITESTAALNPDRKARLAALEQAEQLRQTADALQFADVSPIVIAPANQFGAQVQLSVPVFNGRTIPLIKNAYDAVDIASLSTDRARASLLHAATQAYYGAFAARKMLSISERQLANAKEHRNNIKQRVELGAATKLTLQRADLDVVKAEQQATAARNGMNSALASLGLMMDRDTMFDITDPPAPPPVEESGGAGDLLLRALSSRDDLEVQQLSIAIAERGKTDVWMQFLPSLSLAVQARYTSATTAFNPVAWSGAVMLNLNVPLFDGGARYVALREADSKIRLERLKLEQARKKVESQIRGNLAEIQAKQIDLEASRRSAELARVTHQSAKDLFEAGAATSLDVIDASLGEFFAEVDLARKELDLAQARLGLALVLGELAQSGAAK
jgi:outer membrane protein